jgi:hypothetical protein
MSATSSLTSLVMAFGHFGFGSLHEFVGWFPRRIPLDHLPSANITIDTTAVSNGQFGVAHEILRPAVPTDKVIARGECWGAHRHVIYALVPTHASYVGLNSPFFGCGSFRCGNLTMNTVTCAEIHIGDAPTSGFCLQTNSHLFTAGPPPIGSASRC